MYLISFSVFFLSFFFSIGAIIVKKNSLVAFRDEFENKYPYIIRDNRLKTIELSPEKYNYLLSYEEIALYIDQLHMCYGDLSKMFKSVFHIAELITQRETNKRFIYNEIEFFPDVYLPHVYRLLSIIYYNMSEDGYFIGGRNEQYQSRIVLFYISNNNLNSTTIIKQDINCINKYLTHALAINIKDYYHITKMKILSVKKSITIVDVTNNDVKMNINPLSKIYSLAIDYIISQTLLPISIIKISNIIHSELSLMNRKQQNKWIYRRSRKLATIDECTLLNKHTDVCLQTLVICNKVKKMDLYSTVNEINDYQNINKHHSYLIKLLLRRWNIFMGKSRVEYRSINIDIEVQHMDDILYDLYNAVTIQEEELAFSKLPYLSKSLLKIILQYIHNKRVIRKHFISTYPNRSFKQLISIWKNERKKCVDQSPLIYIPYNLQQDELIQSHILSYSSSLSKSSEKVKLDFISSLSLPLSLSTYSTSSSKVIFSVPTAPPSPRLVCVESNPGPTKQMLNSGKLFFFIFYLLYFLFNQVDLFVI